ncbi:DUF5133 domain-containing protein [Streptomyces xanthophaeus]
MPLWPRLLPSRTEVERALGRFTEARIRLNAEPADRAARQELEDAVFTLCADGPALRIRGGTGCNAVRRRLAGLPG